MAEAESVLPERPKMASSIPLSIDDAFHDNSTPERVNKAHPTFPPPSPPVLPETTHMTNGSILSPALPSPITTPAKPSTLRKSSGKKKPSKLLKDTNSKHSKKTLRNSPDQSDRDNGECPYSDLDSVPKILCPKALERQSKLVPTQPSVTVVKEVKKQPEIQTGLWFSKSGKERRPKTISPVPDRTLFSKVPCKKKNSSVASKKTLVPGAPSSSGGPTDLSGFSDKHKTQIPAETVLPPEQSGHLKCKNTPAANRAFVTTGNPTEQSGLSDKQKSPVSIETVVPSDKCGYSKGRQAISNTTDTVTGTVSDQLDSSDVKKALEPSMTASFNDQSRFSENVKSVNRTEDSDTVATKKVCVNDSGRPEEKESNKIPATSLKVNTTELEKQTNLVFKCRLPFVKLIRKDLNSKKINSIVTISTSDLAECTKNEKTPDTNVTKMSSKQSDCVDNVTSLSIDQAVTSEPIKVSVKKLKASGGTSILHLASEPSQEKPIPTSSVASASDEVGSPEAERIPMNVNTSNVTHSPSDQSDQSEGKKTPACNVTSISSEQSGSSEKESPPPSHQHGKSVCRGANLSDGPSCEKSKKVVHKSKQVSDKMCKAVLPEQPAHLPASSRLMTRALKAMQEAEQKKREKARKEAEQKELLNPHKKDEDLVSHSSPESTCNLEAKRDCCTTIKSLKSHCNDNSKYDQDTFSSSSTPPSGFSDSVDFEAGIKSEDEDLSVSSTPPMDFIPLTSRVKAKKEDNFSDMCPSSSPSSPFSFMNAFKNLEEISFQSVTNEGDGKPISFKADTNYKFSTILMMLKDLHDTREREGTPLELDIGPPSAHVKEEPLVMSGEATTVRKEQQIERVNNSSGLDKLKITHNEDRTIQRSKRPYNRRGSSTGVKKKANHKVPCRPVRSGPGFPGLNSLPVVDSSSGVESRVQSLLGIQTSNWETQTGGSQRVAGEEEERWSRVNENLQNMVLLEQRVRKTALCLEQPNGLVADRTETNTRVMRNIGDGDKAPTGKDSPAQSEAESDLNPAQVHTKMYKDQPRISDFQVDRIATHIQLTSQMSHNSLKLLEFGLLVCSKVMTQSSINNSRTSK